MRSWPDLAADDVRAADARRSSRSQDAVVIVTDHSAVDYELVARHAGSGRRHPRRLPGAAPQRRQGMIPGSSKRRGSRENSMPDLRTTRARHRRRRVHRVASRGRAPGAGRPRPRNRRLFQRKARRTSRTARTASRFSKATFATPRPAAGRARESTSSSTRRRSDRFRARWRTRRRRIAINVAGTANVFAAARDAGVRRVVYASSSSVYGDSTALPKKEGEEGDAALALRRSRR